MRVSVLVNEEGVPVARAEKSLGYGLKEKAFESALRYGLQSAIGSSLLKKIVISSAPVTFARTSAEVALTCAIAGV